MGATCCGESDTTTDEVDINNMQLNKKGSNKRLNSGKVDGAEKRE